MPAIALVICLFRERALLERLLQHSEGCYDDLIVVHDGPDDESNPTPPQTSPPAVDYATCTEGDPALKGYALRAESPGDGCIAALVAKHGGRYFEAPRCYQQEPHWPFAWSQAKFDWILRLDADEFPSPDLKRWLRSFRKQRDDPASVSGYTCIWPLWDGKGVLTNRWPNGRIFLFDRRRVCFFGMAEQSPVPDTDFAPLELVLCHEPKRKSFGMRSIVFRKQAYHWRRVIADSLTRPPTALPCWRWNSVEWPIGWEHLRRHPIRRAFASLLRLPWQQLRDMRKAGAAPNLSACLNPGLHHFLLGLRVWMAMRQTKGGRS